MLIGHLLAARKVQAHQGAETEEKGEVQHKEDILHGGEGLQDPLAVCVEGAESHIIAINFQASLKS